MSLVLDVFGLGVRVVGVVAVASLTILAWITAVDWILDLLEDRWMGPSRPGPTMRDAPDIERIP